MKYQNYRLSDKLTLIFINLSLWFLIIAGCLFYLKESDSKLINDIRVNLKNKTARYCDFAKMDLFFRKKIKKSCSQSNSCEIKKPAINCNKTETKTSLNCLKNPKNTETSCKMNANNKPSINENHQITPTTAIKTDVKDKTIEKIVNEKRNLALTDA